MGFKKVRKGSINHIGWFPHYRYEDRDGVNTLTGIDHVVQVVVRIADGPDTGREVRVLLSQDEAKTHAHAVMAARDRAVAKQREDA